MRQSYLVSIELVSRLSLSGRSSLIVYRLYFPDFLFKENKTTKTSRTLSYKSIQSSNKVEGSDTRQSELSQYVIRTVSPFSIVGFDHSKHSYQVKSPLATTETRTHPTTDYIMCSYLTKI